MRALTGGGGGGGAVSASVWVAVDLSAATKTDSVPLYNPTGSTLGVVSTVVLLGSAHGKIDGTMDALFFTIPVVGFDRTRHAGIAIRSVWTSTIASSWEMYLGVGNDEAPVANQGAYFSAQLDTSAYAGGHDYGASPITSQKVTDARYLAGVIYYRSDRQQGSMCQVATSDRASRGGGERTTDPGVAMSADAQYLLVGFGNNGTSTASTLTGLQVEYQLLAHHGQD